MVERDTFLEGLKTIPAKGMLSVEEATFLYETARRYSRPITWVELGVWVGRSLWSAGCGLPAHSELIGIDEFSGMLPVSEGSDTLKKYMAGGDQFYQAMENSRRIRVFSGVDVTVFNRKTHLATPLFVEESIDVLVIDAAHDYDSIKRDLEDWLPKVVNGGLVICHDYTDKYPGVVRAVDEATQNRTLYKPPNTRYVTFHK